MESNYNHFLNITDLTIKAFPKCKVFKESIISPDGEDSIEQIKIYYTKAPVAWLKNKDLFFKNRPEFLKKRSEMTFQTWKEKLEKSNSPRKLSFYESGSYFIIRFYKKSEYITFGSITERISKTIKGVLYFSDNFSRLFKINGKGHVLVHLCGIKYLSYKSRYFFCRNKINFLEEYLFKVQFPNCIILHNEILSFLSPEQECYNDFIYGGNKYLSNKIIRTATSFRHLIELITGTKLSGSFIHEVSDLNELISIGMLVKANELQHIYQNISFLKGTNNCFEGRRGFKILYTYFISKISGTEWDTYKSSTLNDYLQMCLDTGEKVNLKISSFKRLQAEHDRLSLLGKAAQIPDFKVNRKFALPSTGSLSVELIDNKNRLAEESQLQKHCVWSRGNNIKNGQSLIYSVVWNEQRFTVEVNRKDKSIMEMRGRFNAPPPDQVVTEFNSLLQSRF